MGSVLKMDFNLMEANVIDVLFVERDNKINTNTMLAKQAQIKTLLFLRKKV